MLFVVSLVLPRTWHIIHYYGHFVIFALSVLSFFPVCLLNRDELVEEKNNVFITIISLGSCTVSSENRGAIVFGNKLINDLDLFSF